MSSKTGYVTVVAERASDVGIPPNTKQEPRTEAQSGGSGRGVLINGMREAALTVWGKSGLEALIAALPSATQASTVQGLLLPVSWVDEQHVIAWWTAAWEGPARRTNSEWHQFLDRMMDHGFGRIRKAFLRFATPKLLVKQAAALWRHDHTEGELAADFEERAIVCHLRRHIYARDVLSRSAIAEIFRYSVTLTGVRDVRAKHSVDGEGDLAVRISWS